MLAAEGKAAKTVRMYTEAVQWFAAAHLIPQTGWTRWEQVSGPDIQWWMVWLLSRYSDSYASNQYRALQQFFKWWAEEEELPSPMARLRPPKVTEKLIPVFTSVELSRKELAYIREGRRPIDFNGSYAATITGDTMEGAWYQATRRVARFTMTASDRSTTPSLPG
jgi:integrase